jgi:hypothetical protein
MGATRAELDTDDQYEFRKACKRVREVLGFMTGAGDGEDGPLEAERRRALLLCLEASFKRNM